MSKKKAAVIWNEGMLEEMEKARSSGVRWCDAPAKLSHIYRQKRWPVPSDAGIQTQWVKHAAKRSKGGEGQGVADSRGTAASHGSSSSDALDFLDSEALDAFLDSMARVDATRGPQFIVR